MLRQHALSHRSRKTVSLLLALMLICLMLPTVSSSAAATTRRSRAAATAPQEAQIPVISPGSAYRQTNLVSDIPGFAPVQDPLLVNPWGISMTATSPFWVANNGTSTTQLLRGDVSGSPFVLNASPQTVTIPGGLPTGTVANPSTTDFVLPGACASAPCTARFLFASITGNITGWNPNAPAAGSTTAITAASQPGHVYTGLAVANNGTNHLYAADFANGKIDVFDSSFALQSAASFPFADPTIPTTSGNTYHAYNIQAIGGSLYVTYAKVGTDGHDEAGIGNGFVRRFNTNGVRDLTFGINNGALNSPWGLVIAPASFGIFGGALLVGNFGEGNPSVHAFNPTTGAFLGTLQNENGDGIVIDELWALAFGNGGNGGDVNTLYFSSGPANEEHGLFGKINPTTASATSLVQFSSDSFVIGEGSGHIDVTVTRSGDASGSASVNYNTFDESSVGHASQKSDYEIALGKVTFAPGETSKTFRVLIINDSFVEPTAVPGIETVNLALSNPTGAGVGLGSPNVANISITDNDLTPPTTNPVDDAQFFVRAQYLDFLNREPDSAGFAFWTNQITSCGADAQCIAVKRINVSAAFFLSIEFQQTGMLVYLTDKAAFGNTPLIGTPVPVLYGQFERDTQSIQQNFVFGTSGADAQLEANKQAFFNDFITRPDFLARYSALTNLQYVDALIANTGVTFTTAEHDALVNGLGAATETRATVLRKVAEKQSFSQAEFNRAFVLMEYFGYLRRDPDTAGYNFWLNKLNSFSGNFVQAEMVKAFLSSSEYRQRFGPS